MFSNFFQIKQNRNDYEFWQPYVRINNVLNRLKYLNNKSKITIGKSTNIFNNFLKILWILVSATTLIEKIKYVKPKTTVSSKIFKVQQNRPTVIQNVGKIKRKISTNLKMEPENNFVDVVNGISAQTKIPTSPVTCYCKIPLLPNMTDDLLNNSQRYQGHYITVYTKSDFTPIDDMENLNNIPIEDLYNPGDINIEDYL